VEIGIFFEFFNIILDPSALVCFIYHCSLDEPAASHNVGANKKYHTEKRQPLEARIFNLQVLLHVEKDSSLLFDKFQNS
tara:strand:- start:751 stop:987 length:237 start_codon:yes stop_codon:yes gene_type:complete